MKIEPDYRRFMFGKQASMISVMKNLVIVMTLMMGLVFIMSFFTKLAPYYTDRMKLENDKLRLEVEGLTKIPNLEEKISILEKRTNSLTKENIENRLMAIEQAINKGEIRTEEIRNLQELNVEFIKLKSYLFENTDDIIEFKTLQNNYQELKNTQGKYMEADDIRRELNFIQTILFICISIFGVLVTIFATSWIVSRKNGKKDNTQKDEE